MAGVRVGREAVLRRIGEELRTRRKYAGWLRIFELLRSEGSATVGRVADRLGKDYHGTYVQIGRFRRFVSSYSKVLASELGASAELCTDGACDPPALRLIVRPVVRDGQMLRLEDSDVAALRGIVAAFRRGLPPRGGDRLPARRILALRERAAAAQEILDDVVWRNGSSTGPEGAV